MNLSSALILFNCYGFRTTPGILFSSSDIKKSTEKHTYFHSENESKDVIVGKQL